jgi:hypothetical protein
LDYKANISAIRQHWPVLLRKVEKAARNDGSVVERRFAANVLSCHVVAARPDETVDKLEQFPDHRVVAELAGLNTFRGGLFSTEKIRMVAALAGSAGFFKFCKTPHGRSTCRPEHVPGDFFNSEKIRKVAALAGLNTFRRAF